MITKASPVLVGMLTSAVRESRTTRCLMHLTLDDGTTKIIRTSGLMVAREAVTLIGQRVSVDTVQETLARGAKLNLAVGIKVAGPKRGFWYLLAHDELSSRTEAVLMVVAALVGAAVPLGLWLINR